MDDVLNDKPKKPFYIYNVRKILNEMNKGDISFSRMVELMNETSFTFNKENNKIEKPYPDLIHLDDIDSSNKEILTIWDRTRGVIYNGNELHMNTYSCSNCKENYYFEQVKHDFCPFCGTKYKYVIDVSI
jgi:hypothetical protein